MRRVVSVLVCLLVGCAGRVERTETREDRRLGSSDHVDSSLVVNEFCAAGDCGGKTRRDCHYEMTADEAIASFAALQWKWGDVLSRPILARDLSRPPRMHLRIARTVPELYAQYGEGWDDDIILKFAPGEFLLTVHRGDVMEVSLPCEAKRTAGKLHILWMSEVVQS